MNMLMRKLKKEIEYDKDEIVINYQEKEEKVNDDELAAKI